MEKSRYSVVEAFNLDQEMKKRLKIYLKNYRNMWKRSVIAVKFFKRQQAEGDIL